MLNNFKTLKSVPPETCEKLVSDGTIQTTAVLVAKSLKLKGLTSGSIGNDCLFIPLGEYSLCAAFHFGALVFFNTPSDIQTQVFKTLEKYAQNPVEEYLTESIDVCVDPKMTEGVADDVIYINSCTTEHLEVIAQAIAKSIKLDQFEQTVASSFANVEPIALNLKNTGKLSDSAIQLLKHIGSSLLTEHEIVGRTEVNEKPNVLWENADLEPLYTQLIDEFELVERLAVLDKKIELLARTAQTSLDVLQHRHASRLEWYIIILIMVSIALEIYALIAH